MLKFITIPILLFIFTAMAVLAGIIALPAVLVGVILHFLEFEEASDKMFDYASNLVKTLDRVGAALLGWNGNKTISWECGRSDCLFCNVICKILDVVLEKDHCKKESQ